MLRFARAVAVVVVIGLFAPPAPHAQQAPPSTSSGQATPTID